MVIRGIHARLALFSLSIFSALQAQFPKKMIIHVPVCDVRSIPMAGKTFDKYQETQLMRFDQVIAFEERNGYLRIQALDQGNYDGWIRSDCAMAVDRDAFVAHAKRFVSQPYCWGGCSVPTLDSTVPTGVDCSGLVYLCARYCGMYVPRNARDQFNHCSPVNFLQPGDLIFTAPEDDPEKIDHVLIYIDNNLVIEARGKGLITGVQISRFNTRFTEGEKLYYGTFFID